MSCFRKDLSIPGLIAHIHKLFSKIPDPRPHTQSQIPIVDHLMAGLAVFGLKCPSLLDYDRKRATEATAENLRELYMVKNPPSDTFMRERLGEVNPDYLRPVFKKMFSLFQRGKGLEEFEYIDGHVLLSGDGTGHFSSNRVSCSCCCKKEHSNGTITYYHQMFGVCVVHPDKRNVIPLCPEPILNQDGNKKNDCERNACNRFLEHFRREHPHLKAILIEDGLSSTAPNIRMIEDFDLKYILVAKPGDHKFLFEQLEASNNAIDYEERTSDGCYHQFRFLNDVSLNKSNQDVKVNIIEYRQTDAKGKETSFSWVTNITVSITNIMNIMRGGRARWKVENETFNTLKNLGYNFKHNYGHGKYLSTVFCLLMMLSFLIDQIQEVCCPLFRKCRAALHTYRELWENMRVLFRRVILGSWEKFYSILADEGF